MLDWEPLDCEEVSEIDKGGVSAPELTEAFDTRLFRDAGPGRRKTPSEMAVMQFSLYDSQVGYERTNLRWTCLRPHH